MFTPIKGKNVVVTGSSKGIGKGIAKVFGLSGANVLVVSRNITSAQITANEIKQAGGSAEAIAANVSSWTEMQKMAERAKSLYGGIDILCSNAGVFPSNTIEQMTPEEWEEVLSINSTGTFLSVKACLPFMKEREYGRIILTSSITGPIFGPRFVESIIW